MPAKLYVNLNNLKYNIEEFKKKLYPNQEIVVMVKADGYGAGLIEATKFMEGQGIKNFGVAYLKEAKILRKHGVTENIIVFSGLVPSEFNEAVKVDAVYSVYNIQTIEQLNKKAKESNTVVKVEIAIDTGMTRLGFDEQELINVADIIKTLKNIEVDGVYTHLSQADLSEDFSLNQIQTFDRCIEILKKSGLNFKNIHLCNTAGVLKYNCEKYNLVRIGIGAYGYYPAPLLKNEINLKNIFKLTAPVCSVRLVERGRQVSYGGTYITDKETKIAVLQIGYADGLTRTLSNKFSVVINGREARIIGNICMDTCMIDVTDIDVNVGDEAIIFDYTNNKLNEISSLTDTINYEVITNIGKRVDRQYQYE